MENNFITPNSQLRLKHLPCPSYRKDPTYQSYIQLLKSHGIQINAKCFPSYFKLKNGLQYPGIATQSTIQANEVLVRVPKNLVLSSFVAVQRPQLQQVFKEKFYQEDWAWQDRVLNTYLLFIYGQKQTTNVWYHLVAHLPKEIDIIGFWKEEQLDKFNDPTVKCAALKDKQGFEEEWAFFSQIREKHQVLQHPVFSKDNYRWIFIHLISRCFGKQLEFTSMVPFCQLFNHHAVDGHYDVQVLQKSDDNEEQNSETDSITTDGSYLSQDYIEVGQYAYDEVDFKPLSWHCKERLDLNQKEKKHIVTLVQKNLLQLEQKLNWQDSTILFVPHLIERCNLIQTEYKAGRKPYQRACEDLKSIQQTISLYKENLVKSYKQWRSKEFKYKCEQQRKEEERKKKSEELINPQGLIQLPTEQKRTYNNFLLLTGKRDKYQPNNQVYFCYGRNSNRTLLLRYGFAIEGNKYEHVWLSFDIVNSLVHYPDTAQKLQEKGLSLRRKFKIKINRLNMELILFFRLNSWSYFGKNSVDELFRVKDYNKEISVLEQLRESLQERLEKFEGPHDLKDPKLTYHEYFINLYHQQKQKILIQHLSFTQSLINFLKQLQKGTDLSKAQQQFTTQQKFIFRHYLSQF